jgi:hypothetical protein
VGFYGGLYQQSLSPLPPLGEARDPQGVPILLWWELGPG